MVTDNPTCCWILAILERQSRNHSKGAIEAAWDGSLISGDVNAACEVRDAWGDVELGLRRSLLMASDRDLTAHVVALRRAIRERGYRSEV